MTIYNKSSTYVGSTQNERELFRKLEATEGEEEGCVVRNEGGDSESSTSNYSTAEESDLDMKCFISSNSPCVVYFLPLLCLLVALYARCTCVGAVV